MEPQSSLPYSQAPANCPYPEPTPSSPYNPFPLTAYEFEITAAILNTHILLIWKVQFMEKTAKGYASEIRFGNRWLRE